MPDQISTFDDSSSSSTVGKNCLQILDTISKAILHKPAQASVDPKKDDILQVANDIISDICNYDNWRFLDKTSTVLGYIINAVVSSVQSCVDGAAVDASISPLFDPGVINSYARVYKPTNDIESLLTATIRLSSEQFGVFGNGHYSGQVVVYPDTAGRPDTTIALAASDVLDINGGSAGGSTWLFTFVAPPALIKNTNYWICVTLTAAADCNAPIFVGNDLVPVSNSDQLRLLSGDVSWSAITAGTMFVEVTYKAGEYLTTITLPADVQKLYRMYSKNEDGVDEDVLLECAPSVYRMNPSAQPAGTFVIIGYTIDEAPIVVIRPRKPNVTLRYLDYKREAPIMTQDIDNPIIPRRFRSLIEKRAIKYYLGLGYGTQSADYIDKLQKEDDKSFYDMICLYRESGPVAMEPEVLHDDD